MLFCLSKRVHIGYGRRTLACRSTRVAPQGQHGAHSNIYLHIALFADVDSIFEKVKKPSVEALEQDAKETRELDQLTKKLQEEMSLEAILDEFGDGTV